MEDGMRFLMFLRDFVGLLGLLAMLYGWTAVLGTLMGPQAPAAAVAVKKPRPGRHSRPPPATPDGLANGFEDLIHEERGAPLPERPLLHARPISPRPIPVRDQRGRRCARWAGIGIGRFACSSRRLADMSISIRASALRSSCTASPRAWMLCSLGT